MEKNATSKVQVHAFVPPEVREQLREAAFRNQRSLAGEIRRALYEHVRQEASEGAAHAGAR